VCCVGNLDAMPRTCRFHVIALNESHQTLFFDKWNFNLCAKYSIWKIYTVLRRFCTKFYSMIWTGILARQIPYRMAPSKHAVSRPNGTFLSWKQVEIKIEMLNHKNLQKNLPRKGVQPTQNLGPFKITPWTMVVSRQASTRWRNWCETPTSPCVYLCQTERRTFYVLIWLKVMLCIGQLLFVNFVNIKQVLLC